MSEDNPPVRTFACVWDALEDSPAEAAAMRARSDLLSAIRDAVAGWGVTRATAARRLGVMPPRLDALLRGSLGTFSIDELAGLATRACRSGTPEREGARPCPRRTWRTG